MATRRALEYLASRSAPSPPTSVRTPLGQAAGAPALAWQAPLRDDAPDADGRREVELLDQAEAGGAEAHAGGGGDADADATPAREEVVIWDDGKPTPLGKLN